MAQYSRLAKIEEERARKTARTYILLSIAIIIVVAAFGIPIVSQISSYIVKSSETIEEKDSTPPPPPHFSEVPDFTKDEHITLSGRAEANSQVELKVDDRIFNANVSSDGTFNIEVSLVEGNNSVSAVVVDSSGNVSSSSNRYNIGYDKTAPELEVTKPTDGEKFNGSKFQTIQVEGKTDGWRVYVNDRIIIVDSTGKFATRHTLSEGENKLTVKSVDQAGNETVKELTTHFSL